MADKGSDNQGETPRAGSAAEGIQSYRAPSADGAEEKAPSSMGEPEPEHVEASLHARPKKQDKTD